MMKKTVKRLTALLLALTMCLSLLSANVWATETSEEALCETQSSQEDVVEKEKEEENTEEEEEPCPEYGTSPEGAEAVSDGENEPGVVEGSERNPVEPAEEEEKAAKEERKSEPETKLSKSTPVEQEELKTQSVASGSCGENLTWTLDEEGTLTISGSGRTDDYCLNTTPWYEWRGDILSIDIKSGVTSIGTSAFEECNSLTSVTFSSSVTSIGDFAFRDCSSLSSVTIPDTVTSIGWSAFDGTPWLKNGGDFPVVNGILLSYQGSDENVVIPDGVTKIGTRAFKWNEMINVKIPGSVTSIEDSAFSNCSKLTSVDIPSNVVSIGEGAFQECDSLKSVKIPNSVTKIGRYAFSDCKNLSSITIPGSVSCIEGDVFTWCEGLESVIISEGVTSIGGSAFSQCDKLSSVTIPESVTSIGERAFMGCYSLKRVTIPDSVGIIRGAAFGYTDDSGRINGFTISGYAGSGAEYYAKQNKIPFTSLGQSKNCYDPDTTILGSGTCGENLYWELNGSGKLTISGTGAMWDLSSNSDSGRWFFYNHEGSHHVKTWMEYIDMIRNVVINKGVTSIGGLAFYSCDSLTDVSIPSSVTIIDSQAFDNCYKLDNVVIPDSVINIEAYAFRDCRKLKNLSIGNSVESIGYMAFYMCENLTSVTIPDSVTTIEDEAFEWCENLTISGYRDTEAEFYAENNNIPITYLSYDPHVKSVALGDFNGDEDITMADVTLGNQAVVGMIQLTGKQKKDADVTNDNDYTMADVVWTNGYVLGKHDTRVKPKTES